QRQIPDARYRQYPGSRGIRRRADQSSSALVHGGHGSRYVADERAPAAHPQFRLSRPLAWRRGPDGHARQERPERGQDDRGVSRATPRRHLSDGDDDASRRTTALLARIELWIAEPGGSAAQGGCSVDADFDAYAGGGFEAARIDVYERSGFQERRRQSG